MIDCHREIHGRREHAGLIVDWLRANNHDIKWIAEELTGADDESILQLSYRGDRIVITQDLDFGDLVFRDKQCAYSVILLRIAHLLPETILGYFCQAVERISDHLPGQFVVVAGPLVRIQPLPPH